jgi:hypothetical protein
VIPAQMITASLSAGCGKLALFQICFFTLRGCVQVLVSKSSSEELASFCIRVYLWPICFFTRHGRIGGWFDFSGDYRQALFDN